MQREEWKAPSFWPAGASCGEKAKARLARKRVQLNGQVVSSCFPRRRCREGTTGRGGRCDLGTVHRGKEATVPDGGKNGGYQ